MVGRGPVQWGGGLNFEFGSVVDQEKDVSSKSLGRANVAITMKSLGVFSRKLREDFFLKIGIHSTKVYTESSPTKKYVTSSLPCPELVYQASHCKVNKM